MKIYVGIDNTICYYSNEKNYNLAIPYKKRIEKINKLYNEGNYIIYCALRKSNDNNLLLLTKNQLDSWGCKYHGLKLKNSDHDLYIDVKSINSEEYFKKL